MAASGVFSFQLDGAYSLHACLPIKQRPVTITTVIEMTLRSNLSNWLVRLLSIVGQVSLIMEQNSSLTQDRLASRKNFYQITKLTQFRCDTEKCVISKSPWASRYVGLLNEKPATSSPRPEVTKYKKYFFGERIFTK